MQEKTGIREKSAALAKRTSYFYRLAVVSLFREKAKEFRAQDKHPFGSLKGILQDMASLHDGHPDDLKGSFSKKLENIISGRTQGAKYDDAEHFLLIEKFLLEHVPEQISQIDLRQQLYSLGNMLDEFWGGRLQRSFGQPVKGVPNLKYLESETVYELDFISVEKNQDERVEASFYESNDSAKYYIALKSFGESNCDLAIFFRESEIPMLYFGMYLKKKSYFIFRSFRHEQPMCLYLNNPEKGHKTIRSTASIMPDHICNDLSAKETIWGVNPYQIRMNPVSDIHRRALLVQQANSFIAGIEI